MSQIKDINGRDVNVGDTIIYASLSNMAHARVIKITNKALVVSCVRGVWSKNEHSLDWRVYHNTRIPVLAPKGVILKPYEAPKENRDVTLHNGSKRVATHSYSGKLVIQNQIIKIN